MSSFHRQGEERGGEGGKKVGKEIPRSFLSDRVGRG